MPIARGEPMIVILTYVGICLGSLLLLASPALFRKQSRPWVAVLMLLALSDLLALILGGPIQYAIAGHALHYAWFYKAFSLAFCLIIAVAFIRSHDFHAREFGLSFVQAPGTRQVLLIVILPLIAVDFVLQAMHGSGGHSLEAVLFQATMPGLAEELYFRGLLLAIFDRMFAARFRLFGAELGYGAIATSLVFGLGHVVSFDGNSAHMNYTNGITITVFALFMVWVRCRTRSLVLPVILHNLGNVISCTVPKMI